MSNPVPAWPTEEAATKAVDAAARRVHQDWADEILEKLGATVQPFDEMPPAEQLPFRESVLPVVWAALTALPDPRYAAYEHGFADGEQHERWRRDGGSKPANNPYPSNL